MIIRKIKKDGIVNIRKLVKWAVVILIVLVVIKGISYLAGNQTDTIGISVDQVGEEVIVEGRLTPDNNFPYYTHSIVDITKNKVGLKSTSVNLNTYSGQVTIIGKVERFLKLTPIVEVTAIKLPDQQLIIKNNTYFFTKDFISLDFSSQPQLSANRSGNEIIVLFDNAPVVAIERFLCSKILKGKTCATLVDDYIKQGKDSFVSLRGHEFYKHNATTRIVFEGESFGYVFKNIDDDMMLNLSSMIKLIDKNFVLKNRNADIWKICSSSEDPMERIMSSKIKYSVNGTITLNIGGQTQEKNTTDCALVFDPWNNWAVKKLSAIK